MVRVEKSSSYPVQHLLLMLVVLYSCLLHTACILRQRYNVSGLAVGRWMLPQIWLQQEEDIVHFPIEVCGTPSVQVVKFPLSRDQLLQSFACRWELSDSCVKLIYGHVDEGRKSNEWSAYVLYLSPTRVKNELILSSTHSLSCSVWEHLEWVRVTPHGRRTGKPRAGL